MCQILEPAPRLPTMDLLVGEEDSASAPAEQSFSGSSEPIQRLHFGPQMGNQNFAVKREQSAGPWSRALSILSPTGYPVEIKQTTATEDQLR